MKAKTVLIFICIVFVSHSIYCQKLSPKFFRKANKFFKKYVDNGEVDYWSLQENAAQAKDLLTIISQSNLADNSVRKRKAFYINAYNILLIKSVIDNFPIQFPLEGKGFFSEVSHSIAGDTLTLNEIQALLIKEHKDIRILFVLSSASKGSVKLADFAFKPGKLEKQFKRIVKETVNSYDYVRIMNRSSKVLLAESFQNSQTDFDPNDMVDLLNKYLEKPIPAGFIIDFYPANRKLNIKNQNIHTRW